MNSIKSTVPSLTNTLLSKDLKLIVQPPLEKLMKLKATLIPLLQTMLLS